MTPLALVKLNQIDELLKDNDNKMPVEVMDLRNIYVDLKTDFKGYTPLLNKYLEMSEFIDINIKDIINSNFNYFTRIINVDINMELLTSKSKLNDIIVKVRKFYPTLFIIEGYIDGVVGIRQHISILNMWAMKKYQIKDEINPVDVLINTLSPEDRELFDKLFAFQDSNDIRKEILSVIIELVNKTLEFKLTKKEN